MRRGNSDFPEWWGARRNLIDSSFAKHWLEHWEAVWNVREIRRLSEVFHKVVNLACLSTTEPFEDAPNHDAITCYLLWNLLSLPTDMYFAHIQCRSDILTLTFSLSFRLCSDNSELAITYNTDMKSWHRLIFELSAICICLKYAFNNMLSVYFWTSQ